MKKIVRGKEYDTETAQPIRRRTGGEYGDPAGFEECLYRTPEGLYFLYGRGGPASPYPQEKIRCLSRQRAEVWPQDG